MTASRSDADRRVRQSHRLARVLQVLQLIQSRGRWNARAIAAELECSERTVFRDLQVLEVAGVPWYVDEQDRCYRVRPDFRFPVLNLTEAEALGQAAAAAMTEAPGLAAIGAGARATTAKLAATTPEAAQKILTEAARLVVVLDLKLADHSRHTETIQTIQWALLRRKQLAGRYHSPYGPKTVSLRLHPYRLCLVKQAWYLIARAADGEVPRTYRVARFQSLRMLDAGADVPADFDLRGYFGNAWSVFRGSTTYDVEIAFCPEAADLVTETVWHPTQTVRRQRDGSVTLKFRVDGLEEILWWVLGWAGRGRVIEPPELRAMAVEQLRAGLRMNEP